jgi:hypothetical protein
MSSIVHKICLASVLMTQDGIPPLPRYLPIKLAREHLLSGGPSVAERCYSPIAPKPTRLDPAQFPQNAAVDAFLSMAESSETSPSDRAGAPIEGYRGDRSLCR